MRLYLENLNNSAIVTCLIALITLIKRKNVSQKMALKNLNSGGLGIIYFRLLTILSLVFLFQI